MAIIPITSDDFENFSILTTPKRYFSSSSAGVTGSVNLYARRSEIERDNSLPSAFIDSTFKDANFDDVINGLQSSCVAPGNHYNKLDQYLQLVASASFRDRSKTLGIIRFTPPAEFNSDTLRKLVTKDLLYSYYRATSPNMQWAYTNYHALNFFSASCVSSGSVLLYPNFNTGRDSMCYVSGAYVPSGAFSFDFCINPRYTSDAANAPFRAGTILHLSSCFALSMISGSRKDVNGFPSCFRLMLQLSHSADISPSLAIPGSNPSDLIFLSDDNALKQNSWHHVVIRWGTNNINAGTGSFHIDGVDVGKFCIPSSSIAPLPFKLTGNPDVLCVGNYYEGTNRETSAQACFFATDPATREGLVKLLDKTGINEPLNYSFKHPLNAEIHDLAIRSKYLTDQDIAVSQSFGPAMLDNTFLFYVPPFFTHLSPVRRSVGGFGGVLQTPFFAVDGATDDPFNIAMSFGVGGYYTNLDNFTRDFVNNSYSRNFHLTASSIDANVSVAQSANEILYNDPDVRRANLLIMPCDDGNFVPNYSLLVAEDNTTKFVDSLGNENYSLITLDNLVADTSKLFGSSLFSSTKTELEASEFIDFQVGSTPEAPLSSPGPAMLNFAKLSNSAVNAGTYLQGVQAGAPLTIYQRTLDPSSNQVVFFDVSNILYGMQIHPGSLTIRDNSLSGSFGRVGISLCDDGNGNIYRADSNTPKATWNSVGNVFYAEGIIVIKSPHLCLFGKDSFEVEFKGEQNVHVLGIDILADVNMAFSSSNPSYKQLSPSGYANDPDKDFTYISNIYLHDNNYNVIGKATLAQPFLKRRGDKVMFRIKFDF